MLGVAGIGVMDRMLIRLHRMMLVRVRMLSTLMLLHGGGRSGLGQEA
jgi:hypothetical protein